MKSILSFFFAVYAFLGIAGFSRGNEATPFYLKDGDKVVFYGDSITEQRLYTTDAETFVLTRYPHLKIDFVHSGWGGDRVTGGGGGPIDLRLERDVFTYKPDVVTIMLGMNDGGYRGPDDGITDTYEKGYRHIVDSLQARLPGVRLTFIQPSPFDDITRSPAFAGGYNVVLQNFSKFVKELAAKNGQITADFNTPVVDMLTKANAANPALASQIIPDRVHPSPAGHLIMAEALVKAWGANPVVSEVEIDAAAQKTVRAENAKVDALKVGDTISWTETDNSLPMPTRASDPNDANNKLIDLALASSDFMEAINREPLKVAGLKAPYYELTIDDESVGTFAKADFEKGINLATLPTPMMEQAEAVRALTVQHDNQHFERWRTYQVPLTNRNNDAINKALPPILAALDAEEAKVIDQQRAKAQPVSHNFVLTPSETPGPVAGTPVPDPVLPTGLGENLALKKKYVSSDSNPSGWGDGLTDGSWNAGQGTTFATGNSGNFPKTVTIDLEKTESITNILMGTPPFGSTKHVSVSISTDNQNFKDIGNYSFPQGVATKHLFTCESTPARYVRLTYLNKHAKFIQFDPNYMFTTEVEVYGPAAK